jgi:hypothetical protein
MPSFRFQKRPPVEPSSACQTNVNRTNPDVVPLGADQQLLTLHVPYTSLLHVIYLPTYSTHTHLRTP